MVGSEHILDLVRNIILRRVVERDNVGGLIIGVQRQVLGLCIRRVAGDGLSVLRNRAVELAVGDDLRSLELYVVVGSEHILDRVFDIMLRSPHSVQVVLAVLHCAGVASCELLGTIVFLGRSVFISCPADEGVTHTGEGFGVLERSFLADLEGAASLILLRVSGQITAVGVVDKGVLFLFPLCGELQDVGGFAAVVAAIVQGFFGIAVVSAGHVVAVSVYFIVALNDLDAPALEGVAEARGRRQLDCRAGEFEVVDFSDIVVDVFDSGHILDFIAASVGVIHHGHEVQIAGQLVTVFVICRIAALVPIVAVFAVVRFVQALPVDLVRRCLRDFKCVVVLLGLQSSNNRSQFCIITEVLVFRQRHLVKVERCDGEIAHGVVCAEAETGPISCAQLEVLVFVELRLCQRAERGVHSRVCVDVVRGDAPLCLQGDIGGDGGVVEVERFFCLAQIPAVEGIAGLRGSGIRRGRLAFVFHVLREGVPVVVRVKGHDPVVRDRADIVCTQLDGVGRPDVVQNLIADLLIGLGRRVQFPLNRFRRQQLVCARCVREVLVVACLCAGVNVSVDFKRCNVAAGNVFVRLNRHNVRRGIDERYGDAIVADTCFSVHAGDMDAVILAAGRDLGDLAPVGRGMGQLDHIVNAGLYRLGLPHIVFPADVPAQRVFAVQVVRRILLERLHKVCNREGHDPCGSILALFKRIVLSDDARSRAILALAAIHEFAVVIIPDAVDAGNGDKAGQRIEDVVAGRLFNPLAGDCNDR